MGIRRKYSWLVDMHDIPKLDKVLAHNFGTASRLQESLAKAVGV